MSTEKYIKATCGVVSLGYSWWSLFNDIFCSASFRYAFFTLVISLSTLFRLGYSLKQAKDTLYWFIYCPNTLDYCAPVISLTFVNASNFDWGICH